MYENVFCKPKQILVTFLFISIKYNTHYTLDKTKFPEGQDINLL